MDEQGLLTIYSLENVSEAGRMPSQKLVVKATAYYQELRVGITRLYAAKSAGQRIDMLLRAFNTDVIEEGYVVMLNGDDHQYEVSAVQKAIGQDALDITLERVDDLYDIYDTDSNGNI